MMNIPTYNTAGMKRAADFNGYIFHAISSNGAAKVTSYIATRNGRRVYGYYDYKRGAYIEE